MQVTSTVFNEDCICGMKRFPDGYFDLAIVDPPYGVEVAKKGNLHNNWKLDRGFKTIKNYGDVNWDRVIPGPEYFKELFRVSKNQIIWGGNFFPLPPNRCYVVWYKMGKNKNPKFCPTEYAWCSFDKNPKFYDIHWNGFGSINSGEKRIHSCQKPVLLYNSLLRDFAKPGFKVLDTHLGSGSSRIACYNASIEFVGFEIDLKHFTDQENRFIEYRKTPEQALLFNKS